MAESRKFVALGGAATFALLALTGGAAAGGSLKDMPADDREFAYSFTLAVTSDYVFRGFSQTDNDPTLQASAGFTYGIFYAGVWASGVDFGTGFPADTAEFEADYYAGIKPTYGKFTFDFGVIYYDYPGFKAEKNEALELKAGVSAAVTDSLSVGGTIYYSPDYNDKDYQVYEGTVAYTLPTVHIFTPTLSGTLGYVDDDNDDLGLGGSYTYWNAGLTLAVDKLAFDFRYWDTDVDTTLSDERFVATVTLALP
jgi:uncharacterized protein (TIGR02001 family)